MVSYGHKRVHTQVIHVDRKAESVYADLKARTEGMPNVYIIDQQQSVEVSWGGFRS